MPEQEQPKPHNGRWYKGMPPPNPKGRPRSGLALSERIRERVDVDRMIDMMVRIAAGLPLMRTFDANGKPDVAMPKPGEWSRCELVWPSVLEVQRANEFLATWGFQKPPAQLEVGPKSDAAEGFDPSRLSPEEKAQLIALYARAAGELSEAESRPAPLDVTMSAEAVTEPETSTSEPSEPREP